MEYSTRDAFCDPELFRFAVSDYGTLRNLILRAAGYKIPWSVFREGGVDFWMARAILIQSALARIASSKSSVGDLVYVHCHTAGLFGHQINSHAPLVISLDGTSVVEARMEGRSSFTLSDQVAIKLEKRIFDRADLIVSFSDWARDSVINDYGIPEEKTKTIRNAVMPITGASSRSPLPVHFIPETRFPIVGFVGNDFKRKGGDLLLEAHQMHLADDVHLVLVTNAKFNTGGLKNVTVLNSIPREELLNSVLPRFSILAHPARIDWSPYSIIEALAAGLPIVASAVGSIPEMVENGLNGRLLKDPSVLTLAESIKMVLSETAQISTMSDTSHAIFRDRYNADQNYPELLSVLRNVAQSRA